MALTPCLMPQWTEQMQCLPPPSGCWGYRKEPPALRGKAQSHNSPGHIMDIQQTSGVHPLLSWWRTLSPKPQAFPATFQWHPQFLAGMTLYQRDVTDKWALNSATIAPVLFSRCYWNPGPWDQMIYNHKTSYTTGTEKFTSPSTQEKSQQTWGSLSITSEWYMWCFAKFKIDVVPLSVRLPRIRQNKKERV